MSVKIKMSIILFFFKQTILLSQQSINYVILELNMCYCLFSTKKHNIQFTNSNKNKCYINILLEYNFFIVLDFLT